MLSFFDELHLNTSLKNYSWYHYYSMVQFLLRKYTFFKKFQDFYFDWITSLIWFLSVLVLKNISGNISCFLLVIIFSPLTWLDETNVPFQIVRNCIYYAFTCIRWLLNCNYRHFVCWVFFLSKISFSIICSSWMYFKHFNLNL